MTAPLSDERLAEIRERAEKATPGPYKVIRESYHGGSWVTAIGITQTWAEGDPVFEIAKVSQFTAPTVEFFAAAREDVPALLAEVERLRAVVARARDMHWRFDIYDICGCREHEDEAATVTLSDGEVVCRSGYQYSICHECCAPGDSQTEECVDNHDHSECWPCPTRKALDEAPALTASPA